jgi:hypothetical protein
VNQRLWVVLVGAGACSSPGAREPVRADGPCDLVEAMLSIDDPVYQSMYAGTQCGDGPRHPLIVSIKAPPQIFPPDTSCPGRRFRVFHGEPDVMGLIVELSVGPDARDAMSFMASTVQPNPTPTPDGGFDDVDTYCHAVTGYVELRDHRWRTFVDGDRWERHR